MADHARENWNCIFDDLVVLCEKLEELDIEAIMIITAVDDRAKSAGELFLIN